MTDGIIYEFSECLLRDFEGFNSMESFVADVEDEIFAHQGFNDFVCHLDDVAFDFVLDD